MLKFVFRCWPNRTSVGTLMTQYGSRICIGTIRTKPTHICGRSTFVIISETWDTIHPTIYITCCSCLGSIYKLGLTLMPAWISNHMPSKVWDDKQFHPTLHNGSVITCLVKCGMISNFTPHCIMDSITYPCRVVQSHHWSSASDVSVRNKDN